MVSLLKNKKIVVIGKVWPEPNSSAAGVRMMQLLETLVDSEADLHFCTTANKTGFENSLSEYPIETSEIKLNSKSFDTLILGLSPDIVIYDRFMTEEQFGWRVTQNCPKVKQILNTEDLHFLRDARKEASKKDENIDDSAIRSEMLFRELLSIHRCDSVLLVSEFEKKLLKKSYDIQNEKLQYLPLFKSRNSKMLSFEERSDFMFIGNYYHDPNWDALLILKKHVWPLIRNQIPNAVLNIYGAYSSQKITDLHNEKDGFLIHGRIDEVDIAFSSARICLAPIRFGAGIKGKFLDAMANGTPVVTTPIGAEDMTLNDTWCGRISESWEELANEAVLLCNSKEEWLKSQGVGFSILDEKFSQQKFKALFEVVFDSISIDRERSLTEELVQHHSMKSSMYLSKWIAEKERKK